jgi:hypothetical protein
MGKLAGRKQTTRWLGAAGLGLSLATSLAVAEAALPLRPRSAVSTAPPVVSPPSYQALPPPPVAPPPFTITPPPPPQLPPPDASGSNQYSLSREVIRRVVWVHINQIKFCYQQALIKQPLLAGRLTAVFQLDPQGHVQSLSLRDSELPPLLLPGPGSSPPVVARAQPLSQAPALLGCIADTMRVWEFPPTPFYAGLTEITYPFVLKPRIPDPPPGIQVSDDELSALGIQRDPEPPSVDILF